jgi:hypothetical protein
MSGIYDPIDSFISETKRNTAFLSKVLFPRISLLIGFVGFLIALVFILK